jgi:hypothetical protein
MNIGDANSAELDPKGILLDSLGNQFLGDRPDLVDLDGDDDLDLALNVRYDMYDAILVYQNVGTPDSMIFVAGDTLRDESGDLISFFDGYFRFIDFDDDGMLDLFCSNDNHIMHYEKTDSAGINGYRLLNSYFAGAVTNHGRLLPHLSDIDGDGQLDLFVGRFRGGLFYYHNTTLTSILGESRSTVTDYTLDQNYPNPFNPITTINYQLPVTSYVDMSIYNLLGQKVATLVSEKKNAGYHQVEWDASEFASGVYYFRLEAGDFRRVRKMVLVR